MAAPSALMSARVQDLTFEQLLECVAAEHRRQVANLRAGVDGRTRGSGHGSSAPLASAPSAVEATSDGGGAALAKMPCHGPASDSAVVEVPPSGRPEASARMEPPDTDTRACSSPAHTFVVVAAALLCRPRAAEASTVEAATVDEAIPDAAQLAESDSHAGDGRPRSQPHAAPHAAGSRGAQLHEPVASDAPTRASSHTHAMRERHQDDVDRDADRTAQEHDRAQASVAPSSIHPSREPSASEEEATEFQLTAEELSDDPAMADLLADYPSATVRERPSPVRSPDFELVDEELGSPSPFAASTDHLLAASTKEGRSPMRLSDREPGLARYVEASGRASSDRRAPCVEWAVPMDDAKRSRKGVFMASKAFKLSGVPCPIKLAYYPKGTGSSQRGTVSIGFMLPDGGKGLESLSVTMDVSCNGYVHTLGPCDFAYAMHFKMPQAWDLPTHIDVSASVTIAATLVNVSAIKIMKTH